MTTDRASDEQLPESLFARQAQAVPILSVEAGDNENEKTDLSEKPSQPRPPARGSRVPSSPATPVTVEVMAPSPVRASAPAFFVDSAPATEEGREEPVEEEAQVAMDLDPERRQEPPSAPTPAATPPPELAQAPATTPSTPTGSLSSLSPLSSPGSVGQGLGLSPLSSASSLSLPSALSVSASASVSGSPKGRRADDEPVVYRKEEEKDEEAAEQKLDGDVVREKKKDDEQNEKPSYPEFLQPSVLFGSSPESRWTDIQILTHILTWSFSIRYDAVSQRRQKPSALLDVSVGYEEGDLTVSQSMNGTLSWEEMVDAGDGGGAAYLPWGYRTVLVWLGVGLSTALRHILSSPPPLPSPSSSPSGSGGVKLSTAEPSKENLNTLFRTRWDQNKHSLLMTSLLFQYLFVQATRALNEPEYDKVTGKKTGRTGQGMNGRWRDPEGRVGRVLWRVWHSTVKATVRLFFLLYS
jgi:hypothetical protein